MSDYRKLDVYGRALRLTVSIYRCTDTFPRRERFGLVDQIRRSASSIGANIAEGTGRESDRELIRFIRISKGSASELEHHLTLARDLGFLSTDHWAKYDKEIARIRKMLSGLQQRVEERLEGRNAAKPQD